MNNTDQHTIGSLILASIIYWSALPFVDIVGSVGLSVLIGISFFLMLEKLRGKLK